MKEFITGFDEKGFFKWDERQELVRCKDCAMFYQNNQSADQCRYSGNKEGYCFMAEKKIDN